jgi:hypothetical protein
LEPVINFERQKNNLFLLSKISVNELRRFAGENAELVCLVFDEEDVIVGFRRENLEFSDLPAKEFVHTTILTVPPGAYKCRVVIRNLDTGRAAIGSSSVYIPKSKN